MAPWGWIAAVYGFVLTLAAIGLRGVRRRAVARAAPAAYALVALGLGTIPGSGVMLVAPAVLLLVGYWISGLFFRDPQPWLERWLLATDRTLLERLALDRRLAAAPMLALELLEAAYIFVYLVIAIGAVLAAVHGTPALSRYWTIVLAAELACYAALPFLRSRPPRAIEAPGVMATRAPVLRRLNSAILDRASVQANTIPSGHVAGAVAAALAVLPLSPPAAVLLMGMACVIGAAAVAGRYHYTVDCVLGAAVAGVIATAWALS